MRPLLLLAVCLLGCQSRETKPASGSAVAPTAPIARDAAVATVADAAAPAGPRTACDTVSIQIDAAGVWLGAAPDVRCFGPRKAGAVDAAWLDAELARLRAAIDPKTCASGVEIAGADAKYEEIIQTMDAATRAGFADVSIAPPDALAMTFTGAPAAASSCTAAPTLGPKTSSVAAAAVRSSSKMRVSPATPVVVVTTTAILVKGHQVATLAEVGAGDGPIAAMTTALGPAKSSRTLILQVDKTVSTKIVNRVVQTARQAGYDEVIFAVKAS